MSLAVVGVSHQTAPVEVRERFVVRAGEVGQLLRGLVGRGVVSEAVLLSTCNRTELYVVEAEEGGVEAGLAVLAARAGVGEGEGGGWLRVRRGRAAVLHLHRVTASLESMIVGEAQIQGQVREAYEAAVGEGVVGPVLSRLFQGALGSGGRVRSETELGVGALSVPSAAVEVAKKIFGSLRGRRALVLGAGEMSEVALELLAGEGCRGVVVASRTEARARALAGRAGARAERFEELGRLLGEAEIVVSATAAPHAVVTRALVEEVFGAGGPERPLLLVDIALPRDVEAAVGEVENVFLYDLDDLDQIMEGTRERRRSAAVVAAGLVEEGAAEFWRWYGGRDVVPVIRALRERWEAVRVREVERALRRVGGLGGLGAAEREAVEVLTRQLLAKVLHGPTVRLREAAAVGKGEEVVDAARYLFALEAELLAAAEQAAAAEDEPTRRDAAAVSHEPSVKGS
jgi:glutamyl-tRNA reductase